MTIAPHRVRSAFAQWPRRRFRVFALAVTIAAAIGIYRVTGEGDLTGLLPALIGPGIFPAVSEEMLFRGVLFRWIEEFGGSWAALL